MHKLQVIVIFIIMQLITVSSQAAKPDFFEQRYRGWLWFEEKERQEEKKRQQEESAIPSKEEAKLVIEARKEALDNARNVMIETAYRSGVTKQDFLRTVEKYRKLEQEMQFAALKVGMAWDETNLLNPDFLDELKYPGNMYGRKKKEELDAASDVAMLKELATKSELFVFRRGDCGYCPDLEKHLDRFAKAYGFKVEAVSPDGSDSPYFKTTHSKELIVALGLEVIPTVFLVADGDMHRYEIARGLVSMEGLEQSTLQAASLLKEGISKLTRRPGK